MKRNEGLLSIGHTRKRKIFIAKMDPHFRCSTFNIRFVKKNLIEIDRFHFDIV